MNVGIIGTGEYAAARRRAVEALPEVTLKGVLAAMPAVLSGLPAGPVGAAPPLDALLAEVDVVFVTVPTAEHYRIAEAATKQGVHVFLEWPPATSLVECQAMVGLSEEAGVEVGVSRPHRFHPVFETLPAAWRASLILLRREVAPDAEAAWPRWLADAVDLCCALAQSSSVQRIDAEAVRSVAVWPDAVAFGLRFHSGTYAQISVRRGTGAPGAFLYAAGPGFHVEAGLDGAALPDAAGENDAQAGAYLSPPPIEAETQAFLHALARQQPAPVTILDGLHTLRLVERLMEKLR